MFIFDKPYFCVCCVHCVSLMHRREEMQVKILVFLLSPESRKNQHTNFVIFLQGQGIENFTVEGSFERIAHVIFL